ncbi:MAG: DNA translocase FtsK [Defluviitaleaceae bacterium]|nr:DNA translocase FtsK [Defluviitaleaceae bacterium]
MATGSKSKNNTKPTAPPKNRKQIAPQPKGLRNEIIALAIIAISIFVIYSLIAGGAGFIGDGINWFLLGFVGFGAIVAPFVSIGVSIVILLNRQEFLARSRVIMSAIIYLLIISFAHMFTDTDVSDLRFAEQIGYLFRRGDATNGGLIGALVANFFITFISRIGTYLLFVTISIILIVHLSGKSFFKGVASLYRYIRQKYHDYKEQQNEKYEYEDDDYEYDSPDTEEEDDYHEPYIPERPVPRRQINIVIDNKDEEEDEEDNSIIYLDNLRKSAPPPPAAPDDNDDPGEISLRGNIEGFTPGVISIANDTDEDEDEDEPPPWEASPIPIGRAPAPKPAPAEYEEYEYTFPPVELLRENDYVPSPSSRAAVIENSRKLEETLKSFGVAARVVEVSRGPTVTRYELSPGSGVKVSKISGLADDLALNLAAKGIRIEAPIPGKSVVGIEIPNNETQAVFLREVIDDNAFWSYPSKVSFAMGKDIAGNTVIADIAKMPHLLIAGATGAGKSVCINTLIASIIYKAAPNEVKLLMIDPKVVELSVYNGIPHLLIPVVTDPQKANGALGWAVREMDLRYNMFAETMTRDLKGYNGILEGRGEAALPQIVIIIDELADLMMTCGKEVEESICRLAQKARAAGIHLIIATQRPSVDVITGLIKANVPSRLAFAVSSGTDSRTILDMVGAEKLLGKGDMLFSPVGLSKPQRIQGSFISDKEVENIVNFIKRNTPATYDDEMIEKITSSPADVNIDSDADEFFGEAMAFVVEKGKASTSMIQRRFRIGYNRAARIMEDLENRGIVGSEEGSKPREVRMTPYQYREYMENQK